MLLEIIGDDVTKLVRAFFLWAGDVKICYSYKLSISTQETISTKILDLRPISLSNYLSKIISRVVHEILLVLPMIISPTQLGFVMCGCITEYVLLVTRNY